MSEMKKHINYLENTKWMFENNGDMIPSEHLSHNNLWCDLVKFSWKNTYFVMFLLFFFKLHLKDVRIC